MSKHRFTPEFRQEAIKQVTQRGYSVKEVSERLGVSTHSLYKWIKDTKPVEEQAGDLAATRLENQKLKAELRRVQEERDILKKAAAFFAKESG
jgi:transposase